MRFKKMAYPYLVWLAIFIIVPLLLVLYYSITTGKIDSFSDMSLSLDSFSRFFTPQYLLILVKSLKIALYTTLLCLVIGYPMAYLISRLKTKIQNTMILLVIIPMWMNFLLRTYAWLSILSKNGLINSFLSIIGIEPLDLLYTEGAVMIGMVYNFLPFMVLPIYSVLAKVEHELEEAAWDLGANRNYTFWKVIFPMSIPGVITGITMVFIPAVSTFEISSLLGGNKVNLIGNIIEQQFRVTGDWHFGSSMSMILMVLIVISMLITNKFGEEGGGELW
ncbi:ABC transporter permease [Microaceticoccus formicicus]|uniref:ABC transporter permease n=1 Tax=Microaceticoccus formicicus TaxID=3118105 RepID=UPI003CD00EF6|nr:ABC transporter permease [Peptoniphilaceae bacterium AMB_02]